MTVMDRTHRRQRSVLVSPHGWHRIYRFLLALATGGLSPTTRP